MSLSISNVQYVLAQFDAGVPPHRILIGLQYRAFLPSATVGTIERCLCENGRRLQHHQADYAAPPRANQPLGVGRGSNHPPGPANQRPFAATPNPFAQTSAAAATNNNNNLAAIAANRGRPTTLDWDVQADSFAISAHRSGKSVDEIFSALRSRGYDITEGEIVFSLIRQGVPIAR